MLKLTMQALLLLSLVWSGFSFPELRPIPRTPSKEYLKEGLFEGGSVLSGSVEAMRVATHPGFERWVIDFSDSKNAPRFQVRYVDTHNARLQIALQGIRKFGPSTEKLRSLVKQSKLVENVTLFPSIEDGDLVLELTLRTQGTLFHAHQPVDGAGRLVLDLR